MKIFKYFSLTFLLAFFSGCSNQPIKTPEQGNNVDLDKHVVRLNRDGLVTKTDISGRSLLDKITQKPLAISTAENNIKHIFNQAESLACSKANEKNCEDPSKKIVVKLLLHIHGGLNYFSSTDDRVKKTTDSIIDDPVDWHYPVFISWPTSFPGTYADHLFSIREGRVSKPMLGWFSSPFILIADIVKSVGKYPLDLYYQVAVNGKDKMMTRIEKDWLSYAWKKANKEYNSQCKSSKFCVLPDSGLTLNRSTYYTTLADTTTRIGLLTATAPLRYTLGTLGQSSIAAASWKNMKRRTKNIFYPPQLFDDRPEKKGLAGGEFFRLLFDRIAENKNKSLNYEYQVTVIGHSMGSIVLNNAFKQYRKEWAEYNVLRNIIYMGAACTVGEAVDAVFPLLRVINKLPANVKDTKNLHFYNLMLNRVSEISEMTIKGVAPTGSLLTYIDQHLETPEHPFDRTFGSEVNVHSSLTALMKELKDVGEYIEFKAFDRYPGYIPSAHGEFDQGPFWKQSYWKVETQEKHRDTQKSLPTFNAYKRMNLPCIYQRLKACVD